MRTVNFYLKRYSLSTSEAHVLSDVQVSGGTKPGDSDVPRDYFQGSVKNVC